MPVFLSTPPVDPTLMEKVFLGMAYAFSLVGEIVNQIVGQPILLFLLAAGLIPIGIGLFRQLRKSAA